MIIVILRQSGSTFRGSTYYRRYIFSSEFHKTFTLQTFSSKIVFSQNINLSRSKCFILYINQFRLMTRSVTTCLLTIVISEYDNYSVVYIFFMLNMYSYQLWLANDLI